MDKSFLRKIEIEQRINSALQSMGLSFAEGFRIVRYNPKVRTAQWIYFPSTGDESIELGDKIADLPVNQIEMVLRHEFLHRSVFHGFNEQFDNPQISNIVLDICINRLLFEAFPGDMKELSVSVYPKESKTTVIALADCSADPYLLSEPLKSLWKNIWDMLPDGSYQDLNPASLYFKLIELHDPQILALNPFSDFSTADPGFSGNIPDKIIKAASRTAQGISRRLPYGSSGGSGLDQYSVIPQKIGISNVERFLTRINVKTIASRFSSRIKKPLLKSIRMQAFPLYPSRIGYIYQAFGLTETLRMYWNNDLTSTGVKMCIGLYVDVSGSMFEHFPLVSGFVDALKEFPVKIFAFDTVVREINLEEFTRGKIKGGGGTEFDCVLRNFLEDKEMAAAVIFTDGYGSLSDSLAKNIQLSTKNLYLIWLKADYSHYKAPDLKKIARDTLELEIKDSHYIVGKQKFIWNNQALLNMPGSVTSFQS